LNLWKLKISVIRPQFTLFMRNGTKFEGNWTIWFGDMAKKNYVQYGGRPPFWIFKILNIGHLSSKSGSASGVIERVDTFKLLGVTVSSDLSWKAHVNTICARVAPRLNYLKQLKRTGLPADDFLYFYLTVIRPVLEYGWAVLHHGLTVAQSGLTVAQSQTGVFAEEGPENHPPNCMWYAAWFCMCICWCTAPLCSEIWIGEEVLSLGHTIWQLFTWPSSPNGVIQKFFPGFGDTLFTQSLTKTNKYRSFIYYALAKYQ